jgi:hypothetical protein
VLNRFHRRDDKQQTVQIIKYIFPRQYGLHNVFTSKVDSRETAMPLKDYTLREKEIHQHMCRELGDKMNNTEEIAKWKLRVPKRLRGDLFLLVEKLRILNQRCSYTEMLRHYCPIEVRPCQIIAVSGADSLVCISLLKTSLENNPSSDWCRSFGGLYKR